MDTRAFALLLALIVGQWGASHARVAPKGVTASLTAKWPPTLLVHEAAEFLVRFFRSTPQFSTHIDS
jgi:hypothetical protein